MNVRSATAAVEIPGAGADDPVEVVPVLRLFQYEGVVLLLGAAHCRNLFVKWPKPHFVLRIVGIGTL